MAIVSNLFNPNRINLGEALPLDTPFVIQLEASGFCNLKCIFCPCGNDSYGSIIKDTMSSETFNLFLEQCKDFPNKIKALRIIGIGEPLLNKHIADFVMLAKQSGIFEKVEITTNGVLLKPELSNALIEAGLDTLIVSLEATDAERFYEVTKTRVKMSDIYINLKYFYEHKTTNLLYIKTTDYGLREKDEFLEDYGKICDYIYIEKIIENWPGFFAGTTGDTVRYDIEEYKSPKRVCVQPFKVMCLAANGDVMPCSVDWKRVLKIGNIHSGQLIEMWNGNGLRDLRLSLLNQNVCDYCNTCVYTKSNQPDDIDDYAEEIIMRIKG